MLRKASTLFERVFSLSIAFVFLQIPEFIFQYLLQLKGHIQELQNQIISLTSIAKNQHKSLQEYILKFLTSNDTDFSSQGVFMNDLVERHDYLQLSMEKIEISTPLLKPFVFFKNIDFSIATDTLHSFTLGLKFSSESLIYLIVGLCAGYSFCFIIKKIFKNKEREHVKRVS